MPVSQIHAHSCTCFIPSLMQIILFDIDADPDLGRGKNTKMGMWSVLHFNQLCKHLQLFKQTEASYCKRSTSSSKTLGANSEAVRCCGSSCGLEKPAFPSVFSHPAHMVGVEKVALAQLSLLMWLSFNAD